MAGASGVEAGTRRTGRGSAVEAIRPFRRRISFTYALNAVEDLLELSYPWATGLAIDGLLAANWIEGLPILVAWTLRMLIGTFRKMYDTRVYNDVYNAIIIDTVLRQRRAGTGTPEVAARSAMARDFVLFFERDVPIIATAVIGIVGSAAILFYYDWVIGALVTLLFVPVTLINRVYSRRTLTLNGGLNNTLEKEVDVIDRADPEELQRHFASVRTCRVKLSDAEAWNWGTIEILSILVFVAILFRATYLPNVTADSATSEAGDIFAILSYVWRLMENLDHVPQVVQQISRLVDIRRRIESGASIEAVGAAVERAHEEEAEEASPGTPTPVPQPGPVAGPGSGPSSGPGAGPMPGPEVTRPAP
jgi:ABC-type multidrug transport system fused ATPase/permease subunit